MSNNENGDTKFNISLSIYPDAWTHWSTWMYSLKKTKKKEIHLWSLQKCRHIMASTEGCQWKLIPYLY